MRRARLYIGDVDSNWFATGSTLEIEVHDRLQTTLLSGHGVKLYGYLTHIQGSTFFLYSNHQKQFVENTNLSVAISTLASSDIPLLEAGLPIKIQSVGKAILDLV